MKLHFDAAGVRKLLEHAKAAAEHRPTWGQKPPIKPGLWLVGDQGVYLMSNGNPGLPKGEATANSNFVVYAREINPEKVPFDTWYDRKRASFGGDDGVEFLDAEMIEAGLKLIGHADALPINVSQREISIDRRMKPAEMH